MASSGSTGQNLIRLVLTIAVAVAVALIAPADAPIAGKHSGERLHDDHHAGMPMTDEAMERWVREYYETHPIVGVSAVQGIPVATFRAINGKFDADGDFNGTPIDTVTIMVGEIVEWVRLIGTHTVTNGTGSGDPNVGTLFDAPLSAAPSTFEFTFTSAGDVPFFCRPHEIADMRGMVIVESTVGVTPLPGASGALGFTHGPSPNPTRAGASFRFALRERGRVQARVFDARGRLVSDIVNAEFTAGTYGAIWDGTNRAGRSVSPGIYFVKLDLPGYNDARRIVVNR